MSEGTILELIPDFQRRLRRRAPRTIEVYTETLKHVAIILPQNVAEITRVHIEDYLLARMDVVAPTTAGTDYGCLHSFFGWLLSEEFITESPMARIVRPTVEEKPRRVLRQRK